MPTLADIFAVGHTLRVPDSSSPTGFQEYKLRKLTLMEQGEWQRWLERRAHDAVDRSEASESAKDRRHHLIDVAAGLGKYEYEGEHSLEAFCTLAGMAKLVEICCRDQGVTPDKAEEIAANNARAVAAYILGVATQDPKLMAQILACLGLPTDWFDAKPSDTSCNSSATRPSDSPSTTSEASTMTSCSSTTMSSGTATEA